MLPARLRRAAVRPSRRRRKRRRPQCVRLGRRQRQNAAVAFLQQRPDVDRNRIGGIGLSVGGENLLRPRPNQTGLRAVVADGRRRPLAPRGTRTPRDRQVGERSRPRSSSRPVTILFSNHVATTEPKQPRRPDRATTGLLHLRRARSPTCQDLTPGYYAAAGEPKAPGRSPVPSHRRHRHPPTRYERRVIEFFHRALSTMNSFA